MTIPIPLAGCRHDVLGHALKAFGILRALAECAPHDKCDSDAKAWWDLEKGMFVIQSEKYPNEDALRDFFATMYEPTAMIAAWNKGGGITDLSRVRLFSAHVGLAQFYKEHRERLASLGLTDSKWKPDSPSVKFRLKKGDKQKWLESEVKKHDVIATFTEKVLKAGPAVDVELRQGFADVKRFVHMYKKELISFGISGKKSFDKDGITYEIATKDVRHLERLVAEFYQAPTDSRAPNVRVKVTGTGDGKKASTIPSAAEQLARNRSFHRVLDLARVHAAKIQDGASAEDEFRTFRDLLPTEVAEALDAICTINLRHRSDNPLFVVRGQAGNTNVFLNFWDNYCDFRRYSVDFSNIALFGQPETQAVATKGKGAPFFPDAIKSYNQGTEFIVEKIPFCPLDYLLAVEGALAMRGAVSKALGAQSRSYAAFPFAYESSGVMSDEKGNELRTAPSIWLPLWDQPTTYIELQSFIHDAQATLKGKACRFSSDFGRAIRSQAIDAGFCGFQEFQFKQIMGKSPWTKTGKFIPAAQHRLAGRLNELLVPLDEVSFLEQFEFHTKKENKDDLHPHRQPILDAIDVALANPMAENLLELLCRISKLNSQLAISKGLREKVKKGNRADRVRFVPPLPMKAWNETLSELAQHDPEFEIARALASIVGHQKQSDGTWSVVEPLLGSLLPLHRIGGSWKLWKQLSDKQKLGKPKAQAVAGGMDLCLDLSRVLQRRYLDSMNDGTAALHGVHGASLSSILKFIRGELDDRRIGELTLALSHIGWHFEKASESMLKLNAEEEVRDPIPIAYAACRTLIEVGCERTEDGETRTASTRTPDAIALICQQSQASVARGIEAALRRLAITGVRNCYGKNSRSRVKRLAGRDIVSFTHNHVVGRRELDPLNSERLAAAALIPLRFEDRWKVFRAVTLPQSEK